MEPPVKSGRFTITHPADCAAVLATGAVCVHDGNLEAYSGRGPTLDDRPKPNLCAPDSVSTQTFGQSIGCPAGSIEPTSGFAGTSASAPHVAGALALLYEKLGGSFTLQQLRAILEARAVKLSVEQEACGSGKLCLTEGGCH